MATERRIQRAEGEANAQARQPRHIECTPATGARSCAKLDAPFVDGSAIPNRARPRSASRVCAVDADGTGLYGGGSPLRLEAQSQLGTIDYRPKSVWEWTRRILRCADAQRRRSQRVLQSRPTILIAFAQIFRAVALGLLLA